jgi:hypothetical protein
LKSSIFAVQPLADTPAMLQAILGVATAISGAAAFPMYLIPNSMLKASFDNKDCIFPKGFVIQGFQIWSPTKANNHTTTVIDFHYSDYSTKIETGCHYNSTSVNVGPEGLVARYACNNAIVQFIWQNGTLTLIERACPELDL